MASAIARDQSFSRSQVRSRAKRQETPGQEYPRRAEHSRRGPGGPGAGADPAQQGRETEAGPKRGARGAQDWTGRFSRLNECSARTQVGFQRRCVSKSV